MKKPGPRSLPVDKRLACAWSSAGRRTSGRPFVCLPCADMENRRLRRDLQGPGGIAGNHAGPRAEFIIFSGSDDGDPLYHRIGFSSVCQHQFP